MDQRLKGEDIRSLLKKYRYGVMVLLAGILLMCMPQEEKNKPDTQTQVLVSDISLQEQLSQILSQMEGAGKVEVLLTQKQGEEILYQTDVQRSRSDTGQSQDTQTVLVDTEDRQKTGLVRQINPPVFQGAVILCQGGASAAVRLALVEAVMGATGLPSSNITVLKMK